MALEAHRSQPVKEQTADRMRRRLARTLQRIAERIDKPAPITIDLQNNLIYTDASKVSRRDIDRMLAYQYALRRP